jgi:tripartite-type tricarboxylate transporter receptor subunit TctC
MYRRTLTALLLGAALTAPLASTAQEYPSKAIRFVVPFAPGGGTDIIGRVVAQALNDALGQPVVVDNRGGAGSTLGTEIVAKSPADGYTILFGNISLAFNATLYTKLRYDTIRDLAPISLSAVQPNILVIHPGLPAKNLKEFIELARANPGKYNYASAGTGSGTHLAAELLKLQTKIDIVHVPYKGTGPALTDLLGGQINMMVSYGCSFCFYIPSNCTQISQHIQTWPSQAPVYWESKFQKIFNFPTRPITSRTSGADGICRCLVG